MLKRIIIGLLAVILVGAVSVAAYDSYQGNSTLSLPNIGVSQANAGSGTFAGGFAAERGPAQGGQRGWGRGQDQKPGQGQAQEQWQPGRRGQSGPGRQGQGNQSGRGQGSGQPQAMEHAWVTLTGQVTAGTQRSLTVDTEEMGQLNLELGPAWFADQQQITFSSGDVVTILGFEGEEGRFQAGQITNDTTGDTLHLRDPNGRPLWAGQGQGRGGHQ